MNFIFYLKKNSLYSFNVRSHSSSSSRSRSGSRDAVKRGNSVGSVASGNLRRSRTTSLQLLQQQHHRDKETPLKGSSTNIADDANDASSSTSKLNVSSAPTKTNSNKPIANVVGDDGTDASPHPSTTPLDSTAFQPVLSQPPPAFQKRRDSQQQLQQPPASSAGGFFANSSNSINQIVNQVTSASAMRKRSKGSAKNSGHRTHKNSMNNSSETISSSKDNSSTTSTSGAPVSVAPTPARPSYTPSPAISEATSSTSSITSGMD